MPDAMTSNGSQFRNALLASLLPADLSRLRLSLTRGRMVSGQSLHEPDETIDQVYFFEEGFCSLVALADGPDSGVEVGLVGREGMVGLVAAFDPQATSYNRAIVQMPGTAYRMPASALRAAVAQSQDLRLKLFRALEGTIAQVTQTAACNSRHTLTARCARWLLMAHDRTEGNELLLTQEFLSVMLAVRRSGVTVAMGTLTSAGLVRTTRGRIAIIDRPGLEAASCACYGRIHAHVKQVARRAAV